MYLTGPNALPNFELCWSKGETLLNSNKVYVRLRHMGSFHGCDSGSGIKRGGLAKSFTLVTSLDETCFHGSVVRYCVCRFPLSSECAGFTWYILHLAARYMHHPPKRLLMRDARFGTLKFSSLPANSSCRRPVLHKPKEGVKRKTNRC